MIDPQENSKQLLAWFRDLMGGIVTHPDAVEITESHDDMGLLFVVRVHKEDRGRVIGSTGKNADALRLLLRCAGGSRDLRAALKIDVPR
ncbi:MAG: KH domain-containing protein [Patescibacteria group bacterium]